MIQCDDDDPFSQFIRAIKSDYKLLGGEGVIA